MSAPKMYHYASCSTCKKARAWLGARDIEVELAPIVEAPPTRAELEAAWQASGLPLKRFVNTSGQSYRALGKEAWDALDEAGQLDALAADGKLIRRPLLIGDGVVLVGFKEAEWEAALG